MNDLRYEPSEECLSCGRSLQEVGGRRLVISPVASVMVRKRGAKPEGYQHREVTEEIDLHYRGNLFTEEMVERAASEIREERHPWFCQGPDCGEQHCHKCKAPLLYPEASDVIDDEGRVRRLAESDSIPVCINPSCERRTPTPPEPSDTFRPYRG